MSVHFITTAGGLTYWDASVTVRDILQARLEQIGLEKFTPNPRTPTAALQIALKEYKDLYRKSLRQQAPRGQKSRRDVIVQAHADRDEHGFEVVQVERGELSNSYDAAFSAKVDERGIFVRVTRGDADESVLQQLYETAKATLGGEAVGPALVEIAKHLGGTTLREAGGVYYLPESSLPTWERVMAAFQESGPKTKVYCVRTVMDHETVRAVKDAIVSEVTAAASVLTAEITAGSLGPTALENREAKAKSLHSRVSEYEQILQETLEHLHAVVNVAEVAAASAKAVQEDNQVFDELYALPASA